MSNYEYVIGTMTPWGTVLCFIIAATLVLLGAYSLIMIATTLIARRIYVSIILFVFDIIAYYTVFEVCMAAYKSDSFGTPLGYWFGNMSPMYRWFVMIGLLIVGAIRAAWVYRTMKTTISQFSVGDTLDLMQLGVALSSDYGQVMQTNKTMEDLSYEMTGGIFVNEDAFWSKINSGDLRQGVPVSRPDLSDMNATEDSTVPTESKDAGDKGSKGEDSPQNPIIAMPDGSIWFFAKSMVDSKVGPVSQIIAVDATKEERLVQELEHSNEQLRDMNRRLRRYHEEVDDTVRSEELLQAKMRVHDNMGETLLAAKIFLTNEDSPVDAETVLKSWKQDLALLREESRGDEQPKQIERFRDAAKHLGMDLQVIGEIPQSREIMNLINVGIQECMTNAFQHSGADQMYVTIIKDEFAYTVDISDNGRTPNYPIKEGGGLSMLRESAEKMGATMTYGDGRHFRLTMEIPRDVTEMD